MPENKENVSTTGMAITKTVVVPLWLVETWIRNKYELPEGFNLSDIERNGNNFNFYLHKSKQ